MFIGSKDLDLDFLRKNFYNIEKLKNYSNSLIPEEFRHLDQIQDNQLYYIVLNLRKIGITDYRKLKSVTRELLSGIKIMGYVNSVIEVTSLYSIVNIDRVNLLLERLNKNVSK